MNDQTPADKRTIWVTRRNPTIMSVERKYGRINERGSGGVRENGFCASDAGHSRLRERCLSADATRRQEENGHAPGHARPRGIGVNARAPANSQCESEKKKKIGFRSCSAPPACPHLRAKQVAPIGMEEFQIFYEIKSRRSAPFCLPEYSYARGARIR
jgi:hypothetical protein